MQAGGMECSLSIKQKLHTVEKWEKEENSHVRRTTMPAIGVLK